MNDTEFDDETLMAFADGELDPQAAAAVEQAVNADPQLADRVALFMETRDLAKAAHEPPAPVPEALHDAVAAMVARSRRAPAAEVADLTSHRARRRAPAIPWRLPLAASVATAVAAGAIGYMLGSAQPGGDGPIGGLSQASIASLLERVPAGASEPLPGQDGSFRAVSTFRDAAGTLCREYELDAAPAPLAAVSCRQAESWGLRFAVATAAGDGYQPASSLETLDTYLSDIGAGPPLSLEDEAAALADLAQ